MSSYMLRNWIKKLAEKLRGDRPRRSRRPSTRVTLETLEDRLTPSSWNQFNGNAQHTGVSTVAAQPTDQILWQTSISLAGDYFWHTGEPVFTPNDTVIVPVKVTSSGQASNTANYELEAFNGATGSLLWTVTSDYISPNNGWLPPYQPVYDAVSNRVYFAGLGGTLLYISNPDNPGSSTPTPGQEAFYGTANYDANESMYNSSIAIDTPLTVDNAGNVYFGFNETGTNPSSISDGGIARETSTGAGSYLTTGTAVGVGSGAPEVGSAPALSNDGSILYCAMDDSNGSYLVGVNAAAMTADYSVNLSVPGAGTSVVLEGLSTAAPMVAPDGTVFMGVYSQGDRGFMTHYSANLQTEYTPGDFGWDDTASIVPASMVPSYTGTSSYLILTKYNNYVEQEVGTYGGNGVNEIAVLDPYASQTDPNNDPNAGNGFQVMKQIETMTSPTEDSGWINSGYPDATREWCTNGTAVDPATDSVFINNEDGYSYRWNLGSDTITQAVDITNGYGEPYTPTSIGPNGVVYAINGGTLFALGGYANFTLTNVSSQTPAVVGQQVTFTTTVASTDGGAVPTGTITYSYCSGTNTQSNSTPVTLGTETLVNGQASYMTSSLVADHYHIIATYSSTNGYGSGSTVLVQAILANPTTTVSATASTIGIGSSVTFTATVNPEGIFFVPLGTVSFMDGNTLLGTVALNMLDGSSSQNPPPSSSQTATFATSSLPGGIDAITAVYSGDLNFNGSTSAIFDETVTPTVTSSTASLPANAATMTIHGNGFDPTAGNNTVNFNDGAAGTVTNATATSLVVAFTTTPAPAGSLTAVVTTDGASSGAAVQVATVTPVVTFGSTFVPDIAATLTIHGFGFDATANHNTVAFNDGAAGTVTSATGTSLTVAFSTQPACAGSLTVVVTTDSYNTGLPVQVAYVQPVVTPSTASLPASAPTVTIHGFGFDLTPANNTVAFNYGAAGTVTSSTATSLTVTFSTQPSVSGALTAVVTTDSVSSGSPVQVAKVTGIGPVVNTNTADLPASAATLTIGGYGFDPVAGNNTVSFNDGAAGIVTSATATTLTVTFTTHPAPAGGLTAVVTTDSYSNGSAVQVATVTPAVTANTSGLVYNAPTLTIGGFGFDAIANHNTVAFNDGAAGTVTSATATTLTVTFSTQPIAAGSLTAVVTTDSLTSGSPVQVATVSFGTSVAVNGDYAPIVDISSDGVSTVTVTTDGNNGFTAGNTVVIAGYTGASAGYDGSFQVQSASGNTFTVTNTTPGLPALSGNSAGFAISQNTASALRGVQRSMVDSLVYTFTAPVSLTAGNLTLTTSTPTVSGAPASASAPATLVPGMALTSLAGGSIWVVTWVSGGGTGAAVTGHSLADGVYNITLNATTDTFYRLYGNVAGFNSINSTASLNNQDSLTFTHTYLLSTGAAQYLADADFDANGVINNTDSLNFTHRYLSVWSGFLPTI